MALAKHWWQDALFPPLSGIGCMDLITDIILYTLLAAFLSGFLITVVSGSGRAVRIYLFLLFLVFTGFTVYGFVLSGGLLIFLVFQLIIVVLVLLFVIVAGAAAGGAVYALLHKKSGTKTIAGEELDDYLPLAEFSAREGIPEERALARIKSGFYTGGTCAGGWYVHRNELSVTSPAARDDGR